MSKVLDHIRFYLGFVAALLAVADIALWLYYGSLSPIPLAAVLPFGEDFDLWLDRPNSWRGAHMIIRPLVMMPLWCWLFAVAVWDRPWRWKS